MCWHTSVYQTVALPLVYKRNGLTGFEPEVFVRFCGQGASDSILDSATVAWKGFTTNTRNRRSNIAIRKGVQV
jgi:hypothetical protein